MLMFSWGIYNDIGYICIILLMLYFFALYFQVILFSDYFSKFRDIWYIYASSCLCFTFLHFISKSFCSLIIFPSLEFRFSRQAVVNHRHHPFGNDEPHIDLWGSPFRNCLCILDSLRVEAQMHMICDSWPTIGAKFRLCNPFVL